MRRKRRTSGRLTVKSISINGAKHRSGGCAPKAIELTPGDLPRVVSGRLSRPRGRLTAGQKSADGIVGHDVGKASEALQSRKAEQQIGRAGNDGRRPVKLTRFRGARQAFIGGFSDAQDAFALFT